MAADVSALLDTAATAWLKEHALEVRRTIDANNGAWPTSENPFLWVAEAAVHEAAARMGILSGPWAR